MICTEYKFVPEDIAGFFITSDLTHKEQSDILTDIFEKHNDSIASAYRNDFLLFKKNISDIMILCESDNETFDEVRFIMWEIGGGDITPYEEDYDVFSAYFKLIKLQLMYSGINCKKIKLRTLLKDFGYKRRTAELVDKMNKAFDALGLVTYLKNREPCDVGQIDIDDMIVIRLGEDKKMSDDMNRISFGSAAVLVYDERLKAGYESDFYKWLTGNGFKSWGKHGFFGSCPWIYVNLNNKVYAFGMPGIKITQEFGNHAVTIEEFVEIYNIFEKYQGKKPLEF